MDCQTVLHTVVTLQTLVTLIFILNNTCFHETNTFYGVTGDISFENNESSNMLLTGSKVAPLMTGPLHIKWRAISGDAAVCVCVCVCVCVFVCVG